MNRSEPGPRWGPLPLGADAVALEAAVASALVVLPHGAHAAVAVSGGPDSAGLALLTRRARPDLRLLAVHVRHGLRDDAADADAAREVAERLGLAYRELAVTVVSGRQGPEAAARESRYQALAAAARAAGAAALVVGHTADDQAEGVLLALARGTGVPGLAGMAPVTRRHGLLLVRPLLRVRRADVRHAAGGAGLPAVADPTNDDPAQRRARARHDVLPALARLAGGPGDSVTVLARLADLARDDNEALESLAARPARALVAWGPVRALPRAVLAGLPSALASRVVRRLLAAAAPGRPPPPATAVAAVLDLRAGQALHVSGGLLVTAGAGWLAAAPAHLAPLARRDVPLPGGVALPEAGVTLHVGTAPPDPPPVVVLPGAGPVPPARLAAPPVAARARRPGERLESAGGGRALADLLVDAGIPRPVRDLLPILVDDADAPLWVPGVWVRAARTVTAASGPWAWLAPAQEQAQEAPAGEQPGQPPPV